MLISLILFFFSAWGQVGTTTDALGGASIANPVPLDSAWTNPAGLAAVSGEYFGAQYFNGDVAPATQLHQYGATITDTESGSFPGALGYHHRAYQVAGNKVHEDVYRFAAAFPVQPGIAIGAAAYRIRTKPWNTGSTTQDNFDFGVMWIVNERLRVGALTRGLAGSKANIYGPSRVVPSGGVGFRYAVAPNVGFLTDLNFGYEGSGTGKRMQSEFGLEFLNGNGLAVRAGFDNDQWRNEQKICAGFGWDGPRLRVGYSYQKENKQKLGDSHTVDIWLTF